MAYGLFNSPSLHAVPMASICQPVCGSVRFSLLMKLIRQHCYFHDLAMASMRRAFSLHAPHMTSAPHSVSAYSACDVHVLLFFLAYSSYDV